MKPQEPDLTLWEWLETDPNSHYLDVIEKSGNPDNEDDIMAITNLGEMEEKFLQWISDNRATVRKSQYNDPKHHGHLFNHMNGLASDIGFNRLNTTDYSWGVFDDHNDELKEMIGGRDAFDKIKVKYDRALVRLLVQMPGHFQPWHFDTMSGWAQENSDLNPHTISEEALIEKLANGESRCDMADQTICDEGKIVRRMVCVSEWDIGHVIEMENSFFPNWNSGDVFDIPACIWHLSGNAGVGLKMTVIVTGVEQHG